MTDEERAAFLRMCADSPPDVGDRALMNAALDRAMKNFMRSKGYDDHGPYSVDDLERVMGKRSAELLLTVEAEIAIAASRLLERERCARIAEMFAQPVVDADGGRIVEETAKVIATKIRSGE